MFLLLSLIWKKRVHPQETPKKWVFASEKEESNSKIKENTTRKVISPLKKSGGGGLVPDPLDPLLDPVQ